MGGNRAQTQGWRGQGVRERERENNQHPNIPDTD